MIARDSMLPQEVIRIQYPVRLAYAMTINKAQGQTFQKVGIYLGRPCFAHGQLYVAFSRVGHPDNVRVYIEDSATQGSFRIRDGKKFTRNVVYRGIVEDEERDVARREGGGRQFVEGGEIVRGEVGRDNREGGTGTGRPRTDESDGFPIDEHDDELFDAINFSQIPRGDLYDLGRHVSEEDFDQYVDKRGMDLPLEFAPFRTEAELRRRVSVYDRPGTSELALLRRPSPDRRSPSPSSLSSSPMDPPVRTDRRPVTEEAMVIDDDDDY